MTAKSTESTDRTKDMEESSVDTRDADEAKREDDRGDEPGADEGGSEIRDEELEVQRRIDELSEELETARDRHLRLAAEFDNFRKRALRERGEAYERAQSELAESLLDVVDDLHRFVHESDPATTPATILAEGMQLIHRKLLRALEGAGLERLDPEGEPFDPEVHEALMTEPAESEDEDDTVADVLQSGYRFGERLIRPARVRVRKFEG